MQVQEALAKIESLVGEQVGSGQCYALSAYYEYLINPDATVELGGGVTEKISGLIKGGLNASDIGEDYRWNAQGWEIRYNPRDVSQITVGCIINWHAGGMHTSGLYPVNEPYGHTGVVYAVEDGVVYTYEQNNGGQFIRKFAGSNLSGISSVCIPPTNKPKEETKKNFLMEDNDMFIVTAQGRGQALMQGGVFLPILYKDTPKAFTTKGIPVITVDVKTFDEWQKRSNLVYISDGSAKKLAETMVKVQESAKK